MSGPSLGARTLDLPFDKRLPALAVLLDPASIALALRPGLARAGLELLDYAIVHTRYKPGGSCSTLYRGTVRNAAGERTSRLLYGKCYTDEGFASARTKIASVDSVDGLPSYVELERERIVVRPFPIDAELSGLHLVRSAKRMQRILYRVLDYPEQDWRLSDRRLQSVVLRYKPEYRAVVRFATRAVHRATHEKKEAAVVVRFQADGRGASLFRTYQEVARAADDAIVPAPFGYEAEHGALFTECIEGNPLTEALVAGDIATARQAVGLLARFHGLTGIQSIETSRVTALDDAQSQAESIAESIPGLRASVAGVLGRLYSFGSQLTFEDDGLVHGDMHDGQILVTGQGCRVLDLERVHRGDPLEDVGSLCAHIRLLIPHADGVRDAMLREYEQRCGRVLDRERVRYWMMRRMLALATRPYRSLAPGWRDETRRLIVECERIAA